MKLYIEITGYALKQLKKKLFKSVSITFENRY